MRKQWLFCAAATVVAGSLGWHAWYGYKHRDCCALRHVASAAARFGAGPRESGDRHGAGPLVHAASPRMFRPDPEFPLSKELATAQGQNILSAKPTGEEESEPVEVIDLTQLQKPPIEMPDQSVEPPLAEPPMGFEIPRLAKRMPVGPPPVVLDFLPHSADGDVSPKFILPDAGPSFWKRLGRFLRGDGMEESELRPYPLPMPRPMPSYHDQHPGCPYTGGYPYDSGTYRQNVKWQMAKPDGEETQETPKRNTLEIRPGKLPLDWFWQPF